MKGQKGEDKKPTVVFDDGYWEYESVLLTNSCYKFIAAAKQADIPVASGLDTSTLSPYTETLTIKTMAPTVKGKAEEALDKVTNRGYTDLNQIAVGGAVSVPNAEVVLPHLSHEEQIGLFEVVDKTDTDDEYLLKTQNGLTTNGQSKGHFWCPKSEVRMTIKILEVKVKETDVNSLPKELQAPGKDRTFKFIREDPSRYLLEMPKGIGHQADTKDFGSKDSWWVPKTACEITSSEGGEEKKPEVKEIKAEVKTETKTETKTEKKEEKKMETVSSSGGQTFKDMLKSETQEAAYIVAGTQLAKGVRLAIMKLVESQLREKYGAGKAGNKAVKSGLEGVQVFLDSDFGQASIMAAIGFGLKYAPVAKDDPRAQILGAKMRVQGIAVAGNAVLGIATEHLFPVFMSAMSSLPALPEVKLEDIQATPEVETVSVGSSSSNTATA
jgi:hypothetical protein